MNDNKVKDRLKLKDVQDALNESKYLDLYSNKLSEAEKNKIRDKVIGTANSVLEAGVVGKGNEALDTALDVLSRYSKDATKRLPVTSVQVERIVEKAKSLGVGNEQLEKFKEKLNKRKQDKVVLTESDITTMPGIFRGDQIQEIKESFFKDNNFILPVAETTQEVYTAPPPTPIAPQPSGPSITDVAKLPAQIVTKKIGQGLLSRLGASTAVKSALGLANPVGFATGVVVLQGLKFLKDHKGFFAGLLVGGVVGVGGLILGLSQLTSLGLAGGSGALASWAANGGSLSSLGSGVASAANVTLAAVSGIGASIASGLIAIFIVTVVAVPIIVALILFIINSGAFLVPPSSQVIPGAIVSPYVDVQKTATPTKIENSGGEVTYHVKITAKKGGLTNIRIQNQYSISGKGNPPIPSPTINALNNIPQTLSPTDSFEFEYKLNLGSEYSDSLVTDTVTVIADSPEQEGAVASSSVSVMVGNPPIDCPLPGGRKTWISYTPGNEEAGHGSNRYWRTAQTGGKTCGYPLPQKAYSCMGPSNAPQNTCSNQENTCEFYGYAIDVFPTGTKEVFAPTVLGEELEWIYSGVTFPNGGGKTGYTFGYTDTTGKYSILLTHINKNALTTGTIKSGEKIATLFPNGGNTHLHLEFQVNGVYAKPENYFCK